MVEQGPGGQAGAGWECIAGEGGGKMGRQAGIWLGREPGVPGLRILYCIWIFEGWDARGGVLNSGYTCWASNKVFVIVGLSQHIEKVSHYF